MKNSRRSRVIVFALATAWSQCSPAAVNVDRTRIIMNATDKTVAITLNNDDKTTPFLAQSWVTDADGEKTDALMALPPLQRIDGWRCHRCSVFCSVLMPGRSPRSVSPGSAG
ncbi:putative fimbrial chaperone protein [Salmonella enterica subsp. enterica serovar Hvittingfoss str. A4-620]|nr:putative fimbrial chaperone protein [Salmonella enterica subsp. enterica serovar Hvittingfoss str. A4-620]